MERTVGEIMNKDVVTAPPDAQVREIAAEMANRRISCVVIVGGGRPVGILSERDIVRLVATKPNLLVGLTAQEAMTTPVVTVTPDVTLREAIRRMKEHRLRRFPIVDGDGKLIGLVTQTTILHALSD
ncbi:MAG: CBS domain-containing protein [Deltaproteobacteria bacterium]|nr:MAG: CBS domain-containing protein [Deltaproteobacteria bacterium]